MILSVLFKKKKSLRAVFRHLTRHLTLENNSRTFHRGLSFQEAKKRQLPQLWCLRKNAKNFLRADTPYSIHSLPSAEEAGREDVPRLFPQSYTPAPSRLTHGWLHDREAPHFPPSSSFHLFSHPCPKKGSSCSSIWGAEGEEGTFMVEKVILC